MNATKQYPSITSKTNILCYTEHIPSNYWSYDPVMSFNTFFLLLLLWLSNSCNDIPLSG